MIRLEPAYQDYIWGGDRIPTYFNRAIKEGRYAESWEVSDRLEGMSLVCNGPFKGKSFREYLDKKKFPLLVKLIDAKENLSVQVHPDEAAAKKLNGEPKSEMWIAIEKSTVYAGLKPGVTKEKLLSAIAEQRLEDLLEKFSLEKGDSLFIPAGLIHAIAAGSLLLEVQQNSNTTYRLYDWGRTGRELHLEKGLSCINFEKQVILNSTLSVKEKNQTPSITNAFFEVTQLNVQGEFTISSKNQPQILFCLSGKARSGMQEISIGTTHLIPENCLSKIEGNSQLILIEPV